MPFLKELKSIRSNLRSKTNLFSTVQRSKFSSTVLYTKTLDPTLSRTLGSLFSFKNFSKNENKDHSHGRGSWQSQYTLLSLLPVILQPDDEKKDTENTKSAIIKAIERGDLATLERLSANNKNFLKITARDGEGEITLLLIASHNGHKDIVDFLLMNGSTFAEEDNLGNTAILLASAKGHKEIVELLLEKNPKLISQKNKDGLTPLLVAAQNGRQDVVKLLLKNGASLTERNKHKDTAFLLASAKGHKELVEWLVKIDPTLISQKDQHNRTSLLIAALHGQKNIVRFLLEETSASLDERDEDGYSAFLLASAEGHNELVKWFLEKDPKLISYKDKEDLTPLLVAALHGQTEVVQLLLDAGATLSEQDIYENNAILLAAESGHKDLVKWFLEKDPKLISYKTTRGFTSLLVAALHGQTEIVQLLLDVGAALSEQEENGYNAILLAAQNGHVELVKWLLEKDPKLISYRNRRGLTPLLAAALNGQIKVVQLLLDAGAALSEQDIYENNAILLAAQSGHKDLVKWFLEKDSKLISYKTTRGLTSLLVAALNGWKNVIQLLLDAGATLSEQEENGYNAILLAAQNGHVELVKWLLEKDPKLISYRNRRGLTPLLVAALNGQIKVVQLLLDAGDTLSEQDEYGYTALLWAAAKGHKELIERLLEKDPKLIYQKDKQGRTPLLIAALNGQKDMVQLLLNKGAALTDRDADERTALHYAVQNKDTITEEFLISQKADFDAVDKYGATPRKLKAGYDFLDNILSQNNKAVEQLESTIQKIREEEEEDSLSTINSFRKILNEKINVSIYADQAIHEGILLPPATSFEKTIEKAMELGQIASSFSDDIRLRVSAILIKRLTSDGIEGYREYRALGKAAYVEKFKYVFIADVAYEVSEMIAKRYKDQLLQMTPEGMECFAQYFHDKLISGLRENYKNDKSLLSCKRAYNSSNYLYLPMWGVCKFIGKTKTIPLAREMFNIMIAPGGESISLELRGDRNKEKNLDEKNHWDSRELIENIGILVKDDQQKINDKHALYVKKLPTLDSRNPSHYQYGFCYGEREEVKSLKPYKPLEHFHVIDKNMKDNDHLLRLGFDKEKKEITITMQVGLAKNEEENRKLLKLEPERAKKLLESWIKLRRKEDGSGEREDYEGNQELEYQKYIEINVTDSTESKEVATRSIRININPHLKDTHKKEAAKIINELHNKLNKIIRPAKISTEQPDSSSSIEPPSLRMKR